MTKKEFFENLSIGQENALRAKQLFHVIPNELDFPNFARYLRLYANELRQEGYRVVGDNSGYYLCQDDDNWNNYVNRQLSAIRSNLLSLAKVEHKKVNDFIYRLYPKKEVDSMQLSIEV